MKKTNNVSEEKVQNIFNHIAGEYDKVNSLISMGTHRKWRSQATRKFNPNVDSVLDLCCGTGDWTIDILNQVSKKTKVTALDFSEGMLNVARKKLKENNYENRVKIVQADAMHLPFDDESFDVVTIGFGLRNVPDANVVLSEIYRVLKPNGKLVCLDAFKVEIPVIKLGWKFYFGKIMPVVGKTFNKKATNEYEYLNSSVNNFVSINQLKHMFEKVGFKNIKIKEYIFGSAAMHVGTK
ncbi:bifunctional demethylmenaquinone methyltransferase/2-methoxy-6-polyprenyl-1,4-benzoquinol methylase UbiE [Companilactobacillus sp. DQM5]|uniref:bifunctional demethylmenaquinone methyltransferase/2-methoxy-6-polyprenyl-1,4-benzoquinol methylase UbiE n=1 Tax=Companilactobacillus sp. DQM5 TaxID=3463359 RepID=UPI0040599081